jgi:hypothetical protein
VIPLSFSLKAGILIAKYELVGKRSHNGLVAYWCKLWNLIADFRIREGCR